MAFPPNQQLCELQTANGFPNDKQDANPFAFTYSCVMYSETLFETFGNGVSAARRESENLARAL